MNRLIRSSALTWALGYLLLALAALVAFAVPLWYAWNVSIFSGREEILRDDAQRLTEVFVHEGVAGLTAHIKARVAMQIAGERTLLLTDSAYRPLAGNLAAWPQGLPSRRPSLEYSACKPLPTRRPRQQARSPAPSPDQFISIRPRSRWTATATARSM